jgi:hypothetical protein
MFISMFTKDISDQIAQITCGHNDGLARNAGENDGDRETYE